MTGLTFREAQEQAWETKLRQGFNTTDAPLDFCLLTTEVGEAFRAWRSGSPEFGSELADIALRGHWIGPDELIDRRVGWVIVGGESGSAKARGMDPAWAQSLVGQCRAANVPAHVKQLGSVWARNTRRCTGWAVDPKGGDWQYWPEHLRVREWPEVSA